MKWSLGFKEEVARIRKGQIEDKGRKVRHYIEKQT